MPRTDSAPDRQCPGPTVPGTGRGRTGPDRQWTGPAVPRTGAGPGRFAARPRDHPWWAPSSRRRARRSGSSNHGSAASNSAARAKWGRASSARPVTSSNSANSSEDVPVLLTLDQLVLNDPGLVVPAQRSQGPGNGPVGDPDLFGGSTPLIRLPGRLELAERAGRIAAIVQRPAEIVVQRTGPAFGPGVGGGVGRSQRLQGPSVVVFGVGDGQHVQRVDQQELIPGAPGGGDCRFELRDGLGRAAGRVVQPSAFKGSAGPDDRHVRSGRFGLVQLGGRSIKKLLQTKGSGQLGAQLPVGGGRGRHGLQLGPHPALGAGGVTEVPEFVQQGAVQGRVRGSAHRQILTPCLAPITGPLVSGSPGGAPGRSGQPVRPLI